MAKYKYHITDKYGKEKKGVLESSSEEQAIARLKGDGSIVLDIKESNALSDANWNITIGNPVKKKGHHDFLQAVLQYPHSRRYGY